MKGYVIYETYLTIREKLNFRDSMDGHLEYDDYMYVIEWPNPQNFLINCFDWAESPNGLQYWYDVSVGLYSRHKMKNKLLPLRYLKKHKL